MPNLVEMNHISKTFPGVIALDNVSFSLRPGEVHILLGENGAGKSTLMKILSGAYEPSSGSICINGKEFDKLTPALSREKGISIIYQELSVIDELTIMENIFLGKLLEKSVFGIKVVDKDAMLKRTDEYLEAVGLKCPANTAVGDLRISEKQMVEIAKSLAFDSNIIIMDEPTSSLTEEEIRQLFAIIKKLKAAGKGIIYISHKLKELIEIGDRVTVLKDGKYVGTVDIKDVDIPILINMMVGRELTSKYNEKHHREAKTEEVILKVENLTRKDQYVRDISFALYKGEILGFSGLVASGRTETMEAIFGAVPISSGEIYLNGKKIQNHTTYDALKNGIALVTENRRETGFFHNFSIKKNIVVAENLKNSRFYGMWGLLNAKKDQRIAQEKSAEMQVKCFSLDQFVTELSGGNQQKVILAKWMAADSKLIIFDEPTKGIDVGTKSEIYRLMRKLAEDGVGVIVVSSEMTELLSVCDRIIVYHNGKINGTFDIEEATEEKLALAAAIENGEEQND